VPKIPDGLTVRVTRNIRENKVSILAYQKGRFKHKYIAVIMMCSNEKCKKTGRKQSGCNRYHQHDVDALVSKVIKSYR
jgi:hypothetical protein